MDLLRTTRPLVAALLAVLLAFPAVLASTDPTPTAPAPTPPAGPPALKPFSARYKVEAFGFTAGTADIILEGGAGGRYQYRTALSPRGFFRLAIPRGATLTTWIETDGSSVRPLRYREEDGSKDTHQDVALDFDWTRSHVQGTAHDKSIRLALPANAQDPMSLQLAVLTDFANRREPHRYAMVDKTKIKQYDYRPEGRARLTTEIGALDTVIYSSSRPGSSKTTRVWYATALDFTPVRSDELDDGKLRIRMTIISLKR
jgi:hypothetical protein